MNTQNEEKITARRHLFFESLFWMAIFVALALSISLVVSITLIDFVHGNPNRSKSDAELMIVLFPLLIFVIAQIGIFIVFLPSQIIQGLMVRILHPRFRRYSYVFVGLAVPLTSIVTWYCYDYLTPTNFNLGINEGADWVPYEHGINLKRYLATIACQGFVSMFTILYFEITVQHRSKKLAILGAVFLAVIIGAILGHGDAITQYQFMDHASR